MSMMNKFRSAFLKQEETVLSKQNALLSKQDAPYTLLDGETKKNYCKIMMNIRLTTKDNAFPIGYIKERITRYAKKRIMHHYKSGHERPERVNVEGEEANKIIADLIKAGYLKYVTTKKRDKLHPNIPEEGLKYYVFDRFKIIECEESKYFKTKEHRKTAIVEAKGTLSERRCRALRQIYAQFEDKIPFTYQMVMNIPTFYKQMAESKDEKITDTTKSFYRQAAQYAESNRADFLDTWNSLIRNSYITPHKIRTKDGTIKTVQGVYKVNMQYVKRCLTEKIL